MKQIIAITNNYELGKGNIKIQEPRRISCRLFGVHADICAAQQNTKYNKYFFDFHGRPLTWKLPTKATFTDYNEELA